MKKIIKGFTLIELIVVIMILTILATIGFISYNEYISVSRTTNKVVNINTIVKGLGISITKNKQYPSPEGQILTGTINGANIFYIGTFGELSAKIIGMNNAPKTEFETYYTYSVSHNKRKFEIGVDIEVDSNGSLLHLNNKVYAGDEINTTYLGGNYNGYLKYKGLDNNVYITNIPSLVLSLNSTGNLMSPDARFVVKGGYNTLNGEDYITTSAVLKKKYNDSKMELVNYKIDDCSSFISNFNTENINKFGISNYQLLIKTEKKFEDCIKKEQNVTILQDTNLYTLSSITKIFSENENNNNYLTNIWNINDCNPSNITVNDTLFNGNMNINTGLILSGNTIYKVSPGDYVLNGITGNTSGYIEFGGDCIGFIGSGTGTTKIISQFTGGGTQIYGGIFGIRGESGTRTNIIISGLSIINNNSSVNRYNYGLYADDKISNITIKDIDVKNSFFDGISLDDSANYNILSNISSMSNNGHGISILFNSQNNKLENIITTSNGKIGLVIDKSNNNNIYNFISSSNGKIGLVIDESNNNNIYNFISSQNLENGVNISNSSTGNIFLSGQIFNNTLNGLYIDATSKKNSFTKLNITSNNGDAGINLEGDENIITKTNIYNHNKNGVYIIGKYNILNNLNVFNNNLINSWYYGINLDGITNGGKYNSLNNLNVFNNNQNGVTINANSDINILNNINTFSNSGASDRGAGIYIINSSTGNILHNLTSYNNGNGFTSYASQTPKNNYFGEYKYFGNTYTSNGGGTFSSNLVQGTGSSIFMSGSISTTGSIDCNWHIRPNNLNYGTNCEVRGNINLGGIQINTFTFGNNITKQKRPLKWGTSFEFYGVDGVDYDSTKFIGDF